MWCGTKNFVEPAKYPAVKFDLAFVVKKQERVGEMIEVMQAIDPLVASIELFDIFSLSATEHSLAFHIELRSSDKTLTKEDRDAIQSKIVSQLSRQFKAKLRE